MNAPTPVLTIVQARAGSARLPSKFAKVIQGRPMLVHVLERAAAIGFPVWLATSDTERDTAVANIGVEAGVSVFRGSEWDVLSRFAAIVAATDAKIVLRLTGDCPLCAPEIAREVFGLFCGAGIGLASNDTTCSGWPDGLDVEVMFGHDLLAAAEHTTDRADREHVTPALRRSLPHAILRCGEDWSRLKISVDCAADLERVRAIAAHIPKGDLSWAATRAAILRWQHDQEAA